MQLRLHNVGLLEIKLKIIMSTVIDIYIDDLLQQQKISLGYLY